MRKGLALLAVVPLLAACSGRDALLAQQLLEQAQRAQDAIASETFSAHVTVEAQGRTMSIALSGGGYLKGDRAGDMLLDMKLSAPTALPFDSLRVASIGGRSWVELGGRRVAIPADAFGTSSADPLGAFDVTRYVKDVAVDGGEVLNGKPVTKITGVLDTAGLVKGLAALGGAGAAAGLPDLGGAIGDTRVVVYLDESSHRLVAALADVSMHADGTKVAVHLDVAVTGVDQPVALPTA
jgi:hypothetical protein